MTNPVESHYTSGRLADAILDALRSAGHDPENLDPEALAPLEDFHALGRAATVALADAVGIEPGDRVLDVGSGLGGPARYLARTFKCSVTGIDLTAEFCTVARELNRRVGLADVVEIHQGDALDMPFPDGGFDVVWSQHVAMNIADKGALYREMRRVVANGGRLGIFDVVAGPVEPIHFPVPWAGKAEWSFLEPPEAIRAAVEAAGFDVTRWEDATAEAQAFFATVAAAAAAGQEPPLGLHQILPDWATKMTNTLRNFKEDRIRLVRGVATAGS